MSGIQINFAMTFVRNSCGTGSTRDPWRRLGHCQLKVGSLNTNRNVRKPAYYPILNYLHLINIG
jgi:hypothetical protein